MRKLVILGATGSIGTQTLDVIRKFKDKFELVGISANKNSSKIIEIIDEFKPPFVTMMDKKAFEEVQLYCREKSLKVNVLYGMDGLIEISTLSCASMIVTAVVGMVGLLPTIKAIKSGKNIALANKETLVTGGELVMSEAKKNNVNILPVDSEHGAIFQCLQGNDKNSVENIIVTASGGPFRGKNRDDLRSVTVDQALKHPRWNMGKKISIDSATLMNKGLEVIEAHWLFNMDYANIKVVVHPQSVIHSMVEYKDGSVMAQLASTDMRLPIQYALTYPHRYESMVKKINFFELGCLTFEKPDTNTFKPLKLAYEAGKIGGTMPAILNAANEEAVKLFIHKKINFLDIGDILEESMNKFEVKNSYKLEEILELDSRVKKYVENKFN